MVISQFRHGTRPAAMLLLFLLLLTAQAAQAQTRPAGNPIFSSRLRHIVEMIPGSATDLPLYLTTSRDVYLLITAGASYTEIVVLANPEVSPPAVARALASSLAGTPLGGQTVEWSADRYSAAQVTAHSSCFGRVRGSNTAAFGPLVSGLRRAGFTPHLLLRVPHVMPKAPCLRRTTARQTFAGTTRTISAGKIASRSRRGFRRLRSAA